MISSPPLRTSGKRLLWTALSSSMLALLLLSLPVGLRCAASDGPVSMESGPNPVARLRQMAIPVGETRAIPVDNITRAAVGDPSIVDIVVVAPDLVLANAKAPGKTSLHLWTEDSVDFVTVTTYYDLSEVVDQATDLIGTDTVRLTPVGSSVILEGQVESEEQRDRIVKIAQAYFGDVVDLLTTPEVEPGTRPTEDEWIREGILSLVEDLGVEVRVARGKALLTGTVEKMSEKDAAEAMARFYADEVISLIEVREAVADSESEVQIASVDTHAEPSEQLPPSDSSSLVADGFALPEIRDAEDILVALDEPHLEAQFFGDKLVVEGYVDDQNALQRVDSLVSAYWDDTVQVIDMADPVQVMIHALVVEIDRSDASEIGLVLGTADYATGLTPWTAVLENLPGGGWDLFGTSRPAVQIRAREDLAGTRVLAAPSLLALSGEPASFLAGGEIPIYLGTDGGRVLFEWKEYGVRLNITPTVNRLGLINLVIESEVSELDEDRALKVGDYTIPALWTRRVETSVIVTDRQTIAIGGLLNTKVTEVVEKLPVLSDLPVIGALFKSTKFQKGQTELVIFITPEISTVDAPVGADSLLTPDMDEVPSDLWLDPLR